MGIEEELLYFIASGTSPVIIDQVVATFLETSERRLREEILRSAIASLLASSLLVRVAEQPAQCVATQTGQRVAQNIAQEPEQRERCQFLRALRERVSL